MSHPITCLHLADLHFGVENYGFTNPETGLNTRLEDFSRSLSQAVDYAVERPVDLVLFAGDAYKRNTPSPTEQRELVKHFCRLANAGIPTVMIAGNHDIPVMHGKAASIDIFRTLRPGLFYVYTRPTLAEPPVIETRNGPIAVCCLPYLSVSWLRAQPDFQNKKGEDLDQSIEAFHIDLIGTMARQVPEPIPRILVSHLTVHDVLYGGYRGARILTVLPSDLASAGYDYIALGHIHRHQNILSLRDIPIVYPGGIDRVEFGEADESKGFVVASVSRGGAEFQFVPIQVREFIPILVATQRGDDITEKILAAVRAESLRLPGSVVRITYDADDDEVASIDMKRIHEALRPAHYKAGFHRRPRGDSTPRRSITLSREVSTADALAAYLREHEEYQDLGEPLLRKTREIEVSIQSDYGFVERTP